MSDQYVPTATLWERNFVAQMRRLREVRGMTQTDLARALKARGLPFHQQTIQRMERGERPVRLNEAYLIAEVLDLSLDTMAVTSTPSAREVRYAVDGLRRKALAEAHNLDKSMSEMEDELATLLASIDDRLFEVDLVLSRPPVEDDSEPTTSAHGRRLDNLSKWAVGFVMLAVSASNSLGRARWELSRLAGEDGSDGWIPSDIVQHGTTVENIYGEQIGPITDLTSSRAWYEAYTEDYDDEEADRAGDEWAQMQADTERGK